MSPSAVIGCVVLVGVASLAAGCAAAVVVARVGERVFGLGSRRSTDRPVRCPSCGSRVHESTLRAPGLVHPQQTTWARDEVKA